jgi:hypothetical protein
LIIKENKRRMPGRGLEPHCENPLESNYYGGVTFRVTRKVTQTLSVLARYVLGTRGTG